MSYFSAAEAALRASSAAMIQLGAPLPSNETQPQESLSSSLWNKWPLAACALPTLIVTVTAVAAGVLQNLALAIAQGSCAISLALLAFHVYNTLHLQDLEDYVAIFADRIRALSTTALHLSTTNRDLQENTTKIEQQLAIREKDFAGAKQKAGEVMQRLQEVTEQLRKSETDLKQMKAILSESQEMMGEMSTKMQGFIHLNQGVDISSKQLAGQLQELKGMQQRFSLSIKTVDEQGGELSSYKQQADQIAQNLFAEFMQIATLLATFKEKEEMLSKGLSSLKEFNAHLSGHSQDLRLDVTAMDKQVDRSEAVARAAHELTSKLDTFSQLYSSREREEKASQEKRIRELQEQLRIAQEKIAQLTAAAQEKK